MEQEAASSGVGYVLTLLGGILSGILGMIPIVRSFFRYRLERAATEAKQRDDLIGHWQKLAERAEGRFEEQEGEIAKLKEQYEKTLADNIVLRSRVPNGKVDSEGQRSLAGSQT